MMNFKDVPRILKGVFTMKNISDDEVKIGIGFILILVFLFAALILCI